MDRAPARVDRSVVGVSGAVLNAAVLTAVALVAVSREGRRVHLAGDGLPSDRAVRQLVRVCLQGDGVVATQIDDHWWPSGSAVRTAVGPAFAFEAVRYHISRSRAVVCDMRPAVAGS